MTTENSITPLQATQSQDTTPPVTQAAAYQAVESQTVQSGAPVATQPTTATTVSSMKDLQQQFPKVYKGMLESMFNAMKRAQDHALQEAQKRRKEAEQGS